MMRVMSNEKEHTVDPELTIFVAPGMVVHSRIRPGLDLHDCVSQA